MPDPLDPFALNILGVEDLVENDINKVPSNAGTNLEGSTGLQYDSLSIDLSDEELLKLRNSWEAKYAPYEAKLKPRVKRNLESYLGQDKNGQWLVDIGPSAANLQFEAEETFLSAALSKNPEPVVWADNTEEGNTIAGDVKTMLAFHSDQLVLRRKLALMVRQWSVYHLGVLKYGWNEKVNDVCIENRKIQNFVFDPTGYVDAYGDFVGFLGERIKVTADTLIDMFPDHEDYIKEQVENKLGTEVTYTEWWSPDDTYSFTTFKDVVLAKHKNQYFNYEEPLIDPLTGEPAEDPETGEPLTTQVRNHFAQPKKPYTFLSVFSLQEQPHDITGLIEQNISNQQKITKRSEQIDYNIDASNNGYAYSQDNFTEETAKQASTARKKGNPILIPSGGPIDKAILPLPAQGLPSSVFVELDTVKNDLRSSWGIQGIVAEPEDEDQTARGMILNQSHDTTRIGGGIGDALEQVADNTFNWLLQLYYVFYDESHFAAIMGNAKAVEYVTLSNQNLDRQLVVSVSPDSLKPKDEVTQINLAQALFDKGAIGPKTLLKMLDFPDPDEAAADGVLYKTDPMAYMQLNFPDLLQQMQQAQQERDMQEQLNVQQTGNVPEEITEPEDPGGLAADPASAALSNVELPPLPAQ